MLAGSHVGEPRRMQFMLDDRTTTTVRQVEHTALCAAIHAHTHIAHDAAINDPLRPRVVIAWDNLFFSRHEAGGSPTIRRNVHVTVPSTIAASVPVGPPELADVPATTHSYVFAPLVTNSRSL